MKSFVNGEKIAALRKIKGWEQQDLAAHAGINSSVISRMERGLQGDFKLSVLVQIAQALEVPIDQLLTLSWQQKSPEFPAELENSFRILSLQPIEIQKHVAAIVMAYLEHLPKEDK
jgi:transcriptional regulator with XRE-family HTH domain